MAAFDLRGRAAVVTGGNGGIGLGIASVLGRAGAAVAIWGRDEAKTARAVAELAGEGTRAIGIRCDVTDEAAVERSTAATVEQLGRLDICVANAGMGLHLPFIEHTRAQWDGGIATNLTSVFLCFRESARHMVAAGEGGALVAVSSIASRHAAPLMASYAAAKAAIGGLVRTVATELAPHGIRCNALVPGFTENARIQADSAPAEYNAEVVASIPAGRWGTPADLGQAALYLCDPTLAYQTGAEVVVDGGYSVMPPFLAVRNARAGDAADA